MSQETQVPAESTETADEPQPTLLEQMGGITGLIYSAVPIVVFIVVNGFFDWQPAIWAAGGAAVLIAVWRLVRKQPLQPVISGLLGIAIAAFFVVRTGSARGFFLFGIWVSLAYCGAFLLSAIVRWPLAGVLWSVLNGTGFGWRSDRIARRYYDVATLVWILVFGSKFAVQQWFYDQNQVDLLGIARIAMGPLTIVAAAITVWAVHKADKRLKALAAAAVPAESVASSPAT